MLLSDLFLRALCICLDYGALVGDVSAVFGGAGVAGGTSGAGGVCVRVFRELFVGVDELWNDAFADVLRAGVCVDERLVPGGGGGVDFECVDLVYGGVWVVEAVRDLVAGIWRRRGRPFGRLPLRAGF